MITYIYTATTRLSNPTLRQFTNSHIQSDKIFKLWLFTRSHLRNYCVWTSQQNHILQFPETFPHTEDILWKHHKPHCSQNCIPLSSLILITKTIHDTVIIRISLTAPPFKDATCRNCRILNKWVKSYHQRNS